MINMKQMNRKLNITMLVGVAILAIMCWRADKISDGLRMQIEQQEQRYIMEMDSIYCVIDSINTRCVERGCGRSPIQKIDDFINEVDSLISAIMFVESSYRPNAYNATSGATGCMQIMPVMVDEVNRILGLDEYDLEDRWCCDRSVEMFLVWKNHHHANSDWETIARHWWGGPKWGEHAISDFYWEKVESALNS